MKIKKVNELYLSDYTEEELKNYREGLFSTGDKYNIFGELLEKNLHTKPKYIKLFDSDNLESCINWYKDYLDEVKDMDFLESKTRYKLSGSIRIIKYHNIILTETSYKMIDLDVLLSAKKFNI